MGRTEALFLILVRNGSHITQSSGDISSPLLNGPWSFIYPCEGVCLNSLFLLHLLGPLAKVPVIPGEDTAVASPFPGSVSDLMEVACRAWLLPVPADPGTCPSGVQILIIRSCLRGTTLWVGQWSAGLGDSESAAVVQ